MSSGFGVGSQPSWCLHRIWTGFFSFSADLGGDAHRRQLVCTRLSFTICVSNSGCRTPLSSWWSLLVRWCNIELGRWLCGEFPALLTAHSSFLFFFPFTFAPSPSSQSALFFIPRNVTVRFFPLCIFAIRFDVEPFFLAWKARGSWGQPRFPLEGLWRCQVRLEFASTVCVLASETCNRRVTTKSRWTSEDGVEESRVHSASETICHVYLFLPLLL